MNFKPFVIAALALAGATAAGLAQAHDTRVGVSVNLGGPVLTLPLPPLPPLPGLHFLVPPGVVVGGPAPRHIAQRDSDRDGIPDRHDRLYNPRWDVGGDGIPNRHDRYDNRRWGRDGDGRADRHERRDDRRDDRRDGHHEHRGWR